ncbi:MULTISPECIES: sugar ABC transporter ATP-binding protein [unclassified Sinorhizobium]|uniref:sugar ABC transporter ATP-binding protein n=1 Tax=unclassified Sinorhizobium TaxID=2613772 RepID=UPI0024C39799|nr:MULTISPECIES: sugar ABC transporter ATP-binding protein [unclassified Sinorhizobium]MDK1377270.1 sugar ABC transporter ATP-binding protein [Sinorhizobium sp. 6-70]MDK1482827.1 sugar ABC transporter ATP-binding protein [Sinorhizobium sp. 6-117]
MTKLRLSGVSKAYGATLALRRGDLEVMAGEVHVLMGSNGSGKSTLCKVIAGSVRPDAGKILIDNRPVTITGPHAAHAQGIGIFYQELSLAAHRSVEENICLAALPIKSHLFVDRTLLKQRAARYIRLFEEVAGEGFSADALVGNLRPDQRQLVEIMKALASEAPIMIFDEPTSALDRAQVDRFFEILRDLKRQDRGVIFISHRMDEIKAIGDRVTIIRDGETITTLNLAETDAASVIRLMVGGSGDMPASQSSAPAVVNGKDGAAMTVRDLSGRGFRNVSFEVAKGEILGFGGLHGQGQSALLRAIFGAGSISSGEVLIGDGRFDASSPRDAIRRGCAYVSGDRGRDGVISGRPIIENVTPIHYLRDRLLIARPSKLRDKVVPALQSMHTKFQSLFHPINSLSGGNQQKVIIARWLIDRPDVLLLDDPTKGIDLSAKADLFALIRQLAAEGLGILLYSSEDAELLGNANRILVFNGGSISRELTGGDRTRYNLYQAAYEAA